MKKLISSIISLLMTLIVSISCLFAWYTSNDIVTANNILASSAGEDYSFKLYIMKSSEWIQLNTKLQFDEINPGDIVYFKLEATKLTDNDKGFEGYFSDIVSGISSDIRVENDSVVLQTMISNKVVKLYDLRDNQVLINNKILYNYSDSKLSLVDYKIENIMYMYYAQVNNGLYELVDKNSDNTIDEKDQIDKISITNIEKGEKEDVLFALEYNEKASIVEGYGSNLFAYQTLAITKFKIDLK